MGSNQHSSGALARPASLPRRLAAFIYDLLLLLALWLVASAVALTLLLLVVGNETLERRDVALQGPVYQSFLLCVAFAFYGWFWTHGGQTLGMRAWRLYVIGQHGAGISWQQALQRFFAGLLSTLTLGLGLWWLLWDSEGKSWSDHLSGTQVLYVPR